MWSGISCDGRNRATGELSIWSSPTSRIGSTRSPTASCGTGRAPRTRRSRRWSRSGVTFRRFATLTGSMPGHIGCSCMPRTPSIAAAAGRRPPAAALTERDRRRIRIHRSRIGTSSSAGSRGSPSSIATVVVLQHYLDMTHDGWPMRSASRSGPSTHDFTTHARACVPRSTPMLGPRRRRLPE